MYSKLQDGSFMVCGYVARDAQNKTTQSGKSFTTWSVAVGQKQKPDGQKETIWTNCNAWGEAAEFAASIRKGDTVFCIGRLETNESGGKTYKNLVCEFVSVMGKNAAPGHPEDINAMDDYDEFGGLLGGDVPF